MRKLLIPFSIAYGILIIIRHFLYDFGFKKVYTPKIPTICVGNLELGGTGKTPMVYYIMSLLDRYDIVLLTRGYARKTKGLVVATEKNATPFDVGDEAYMLILKNKKLTVVASADRKKGVEEIYKLGLKSPLILMDDGFQHRKIKPHLNLLLTNFTKPFYKNYLLPVGSLRDVKVAHKRADILVLTKSNNKEINFLEVEKHTNFKKTQIIKSATKFGKPICFNLKNTQYIKTHNIVTISGIANNNDFIKAVKKNYNVVESCKFRDHRYYTNNEIKEIIKNCYKRFENYRIVCTEKDFVKLKFLEIVKKNIDIFFYIPVYTYFDTRSEKILKEKINNTISKWKM